MTKIIGGIQQIGIGVPSVSDVFPWYRANFGSDIKVFDEAAEAPLMTKYTGGVVHSRQATMALNLQGGGGFEIWQFTSRKTEKPEFEVSLGDLGIYIARIKSKSVVDLHKHMKKMDTHLLSDVVQAPNGSKHFFVQDPNGNIFDVVDGDGWFKQEKHPSGGVAGAMIGVSDIDKALTFYSEILDYDKVLYDESGVFEDLSCLPGGNRKVRRVLLDHTEPRKGPFSRLFGPTKIELIQLLDDQPKKIFENRMWGDWGFIHLCIDVSNMDAMERSCKEKGFEFTIDSGKTFDMGDAAGRFSYTEDPDGTLIEFVEAHKMPIIKKIGWYYNLQKRDRTKALPNWIINALRFSRVK